MTQENLKDGFKLFHIKDSKLHEVRLSEEQEYIFQRLALGLIATSGEIVVNKDPICKLGTGYGCIIVNK